MSDDDTKYGHLRADGVDSDRADRDDGEDEEERDVEVKRHTVVIDDESDEAVDDRGVRYHFYVGGGAVVGYTAGHFFELSDGKIKSQVDPMLVGWSEIGDEMKRRFEDEIGVDDINRHLDLPEHLRRVERGGVEKTEEAEQRDELDERLDGVACSARPTLTTELPTDSLFALMRRADENDTPYPDGYPLVALKD